MSTSRLSLSFNMCLIVMSNNLAVMANFVISHKALSTHFIGIMAFAKNL